MLATTCDIYSCWMKYQIVKVIDLFILMLIRNLFK